MVLNKYNLSFTAGGLLYNETIKIASLFLELKDWSEVQSKVVETNLLQAKATSSLKRISTEIISRLRLLELDELEYLVTTNYQNQIHLLWVTICRRYGFIGDFAREVIREHYLLMRPSVSLDEFSSFYMQKIELHPELENISESTKGKLRQVLFKIATDAGILSKDKLIIPTFLSSELAKRLSSKSTNDFKFFPIHDSEVQRLLENV